MPVVWHDAFLNDMPKLLAKLQGVSVDVKSVVDPASVPKGLTYWSL